MIRVCDVVDRHTREVKELLQLDDGRYVVRNPRSRSAHAYDSSRYEVLQPASATTMRPTVHAPAPMPPPRQLPQNTHRTSPQGPAHRQQAPVDRWARRNLDGDIRVSSCPTGAGPNLGTWMMQRNYTYHDAASLFGMSSTELQRTISTGFAPSEEARTRVRTRTGINLVELGAVNLQSDAAASSGRRAAAEELGEWLRENGLTEYSDATAELGISANSLARALRAGTTSPEAKERIYAATGIYLDD